MYDNRKYVVIYYNDINQIDFSEILESSIESVRRSVDGDLTFVKYEGDMPPSVEALTNRSPEFTHEQFLLVLASPDWSMPDVQPV
jgi:hypothetical protein